ncbi:MAG TPA: amidohydrolase family protein, partial [Anaerolineae bacterium]|nr:amidohydrolase family protein [Anaerolineae bacterium]
ECWQEYGRRPVELLAEAGVMGPRFVAVHATHLTGEEIAALGRAGAFVCLCRTTERDLGDGLPQSRDLVQAGVKLCLGVDSHAGSDAFEEIRAVELDDRSRTEARHVVAEAAGLLEMATSHGYQAIGFGQAGQVDRVSLNANDASLAGAADDRLAEAVIFGATPRAVDEVVVEGRTIVGAGVHLAYEESLRGYSAALRKLGLA